MFDYSLHHQHDTGMRAETRCEACSRERTDSFCRLPETARSELSSIRSERMLPKGSPIITEGQPANGVFLLCSGRAKLSTCSRDGRVMIVGIAGRGDLIGLTAVLTGTDYEVTAEALEMCHLGYFPKISMLRYLEANPAAAVNAARQMGRKLLEAHQKLCTFGMSEPVLVKLAKLILDWSEPNSRQDTPVRLRNSFTHEEIAEMIGASRETVTRTLRELRERGLVTLKGSDLVIHDRHSLSLTAGRLGWCGAGVTSITDRGIRG